MLAPKTLAFPNDNAIRRKAKFDVGLLTYLSRKSFLYNSAMHTMMFDKKSWLQVSRKTNVFVVSSWMKAEDAR